MNAWRGRGLDAIGPTRWRRLRSTVFAEWPLVVIVAIIVGIGLLNLYSAVHGTRHAAKFDDQVRWMFVGALAFVAAAALDYRALLRVAWIGFAVAVVALVVVDVFGSNAKGSERWVRIGALGGQPSEVAKLAVIMVLARLISESPGGKVQWTTLAPKLAVLTLPVFLIAIQPDLGTATLTALIMLSVGFLALRDVWPMVYALFAMVAAVPLLWESMHEYQKGRVLAFLDPTADSTGSGWHTLQSIFAVGSGKFLGKGYMEGTQNQFDFLPEHWTDFPFSVWAEEWGFVGAFVLLAVFAFLIVWLLNIALKAKDTAGAVICLGVAAMTFWHVVVNVAMVLGMAPVVGVTLPFISYGGSSLLTFFIGMGLCASVSLRRE